MAPSFCTVLFTFPLVLKSCLRSFSFILPYFPPPFYCSSYSLYPRTRITRVIDLLDMEYFKKNNRGEAVYDSARILKAIVKYNVIPCDAAPHRDLAHHGNHWKTKCIFDHLYK